MTPINELDDSQKNDELDLFWIIFDGCAIAWGTDPYNSI